MDNKNWLKSGGLVVLVLSFPILWLYNQKINYRSFFQVDRSMLLSGSDERTDNLSSVVHVLDVLRNTKASPQLSPKNIATSEFGVLGRIIGTNYGTLEIYEYGSEKEARKLLSQLGGKNMYVYNNLLIRNNEGNSDLFEILKASLNED